MSKITLAPDVSGSGTFTIAAPNSNADRTLTLPDNSGTVQTELTNGFGFRNRLINSDMRIDQRNAGAAVTFNNASLAFIVDRFGGFEDTDGVMTGQQDSSAPPGFINSVKVTTTTADASLGATQLALFRQNIEGTNVSDLGWGSANAQTVTLSFWTRSSLTGTFGGSVTNATQNRSYPFSYSISAANTWEYKTITIPGDTTGTWLTNNGTGLQINFGLGIGSTYSGTSGAWAGAALFAPTGAVSVIGTLNATWYITGVQLEVGSVATPFERRPFGTELQLAQRYYWKSYLPAAVPGSVSTAYLLRWVGSGDAYNTLAVVSFPVEMRATPTTTLYNPYTGAVGNYAADASTYTSFAFTTGTSGFYLRSNGQVIGANVFTSVHVTASAEL